MRLDIYTGIIIERKTVFLLRILPFLLSLLNSFGNLPGNISKDFVTTAAGSNRFSMCRQCLQAPKSSCLPIRSWPQKDGDKAYFLCFVPFNSSAHFFSPEIL